MTRSALVDALAEILPGIAAGIAEEAKAEAEARLKARQDAWLKAQEAALDEVAALADPLVQEDRAAIEAELIGAAETAANEQDFDTAEALLSHVGPRVAAAQQVVAKHAAHLRALAAAKEAAAALDAEVVKPDRALIEKELIDKAEAAAGNRDYVGAGKLLAKVAPACLLAQRVMAEDKAYQESLTAAKDGIATLTEPVIAPDKEKIETDLVAKAAEAAGKRQYDVAAGLLAQVADQVVAAKALAVKAAAYADALKALKDRLALIIAPVVAPEVVAIRTTCIAAAEAAATPGRDYPTAMAALAPAAALCDAAELHARRYAAGLAVTIQTYDAAKSAFDRLSNRHDWPGYSGSPVAPGISDTLATVRQEVITAAEAHATGGRYLEAMRLLETMSARLAPVSSRRGEFSDYLDEIWRLYQAGEAAKNAAPCGELATAHDRLRAAYEAPALVAARGGDYVGALARLGGWEAKREALEAVATHWNAATTAHGTLTGASIVSDANRVWDQLIYPAALDINGDALVAATAKLQRVVVEAPRIVAYGTALDVAEAALGSAQFYTEDDTDLRNRYLATAATCVAAWDYAGAKALLAKVPAAVAAAEASLAGYEETQSANATAQGLVGRLADDSDAAIAAVEGLLPALESHDQTGQIAGRIKAVKDLIAEAKAQIAGLDLGDPVNQVDAELAKGKLAQAGTKAVEARDYADKIDDLTRRYRELSQRINAIDAVVAPKKQALKDTYLTPGGTGITADNMSGKLDLIARGEAECVKVEEMARLGLAYGTARQLAETTLATLTDPFLATDKAQIKLATLDPAAVEATAWRFREATELLQPVAEAVALAGRILAEKAKYDPLEVKVRNNWTSAGNNHGIAVSRGLPNRADVDAALLAIETTQLDAAAALLSGRGTGAPALADLQKAVALLEAGKIKSNEILNETYYYAEMATKKNAAKSALDTLKGHAGQAEVAVEISGLDARFTNAAALATAGLSAEAGIVYAQIEREAAGATRIAAAAAAYEVVRQAAALRATTCEGKVTALSPACVPIAARFATLQAETLEAAAKLAKGREFGPAEALLKTVEERCDALETIVAAEELYRPALATAELELAKLTPPENLPEATRITQQFVAPAKAAAARLEHPTAMTLLGKVAAEVAAAKAIADGLGEAQTARERAADALGGPLPGATGAVDTLLAPLLTHTAAPAIKDLTDAIALVIAAARAATPPGDAAQQLTKAADDCVVARLAAERHAAFAIALKAAEDAGKALVDPLVAADAAAIGTQQIEPAKAKAAAPERQFVEAMALLDAAQGAAATAEAILKRDVAFRLTLQKAQSLLDALGALKPTKDAVIGDAAERIQTTQLDAAKTLAGLPQRDHAGAEKLLAGIAGACKTLALEKKAKAGTAPTETEIKELLAEPGGGKQLDTMVAGLSDTTQRGVMDALIKLRFDLDSFKNFKADGTAKLATEGKSKSLKKIYELMAKVPDSHTRDNPSLDRIERFGGKAGLPENVKRGSYFAGGDKRVVLSCGRATDASPQPLQGVALALPEVEPDCEMVPDSEVPAPKYFDWTTLHEVGHAIDDKKRFMQGKAGDGAFGGWQEHGRDVMPVAKAVGKACNFEGAAAEAYLAAYLLGGKPGAPLPPSGRDADWDAARQSAVKWCDEIRVDKELWANGGATASHAVDGRVYHEAYAGSWVSYDLAARTKGITGYQFRAPGEWLSELYAAFHCGKLKKSHPAAAWLETL